MKVICLHILLLLSCCSYVHGTSGGALNGACNNMIPQHSGNSAQTSAPPFQITLDKTMYAGGDVITVNLSRTATNQFKGFFIQARNQDGTKIPGFALIQNSKFLQCDTPNDAVTHTEASPKDSVTFQFTAPATSRGNITIVATAVESFNTFWVRIPSETIVDLAPTGASTTILPNFVIVTLSVLCIYLFQL